MTFKTAPQMSTGSPSTTNGNSDHNIDFGYYSIRKLKKGVTMEKLALKLGFILKYKRVDRIQEATFLKGWWQSTSKGLRWLPLPSLLLKLGKIMNDPCKIMKTKNIQLAYSRCLYSLARSPGIIPVSYPCLGPFVAKLLELSSPTLLNVPRKYKRLVVTSDPGIVDLDSVVASLSVRYNISQEELTSFERLIQKIEAVPLFLNHVVLDKLMSDYA